MLAAIVRSRQGFVNASQDFQVVNKQSSKALGALRHTVWLLLRTPGQSSSQNRDQSEEQASGNSPGSTGPDHLGSGLCHSQAGRQVAGAARVAPANGVASWRQRLGSRSRHQGHAQADPEGARSWPGATAWLPRVVSAACQQDISPQAPASSGPSLCTEGL